MTRVLIWMTVGWLVVAQVTFGADGDPKPSLPQPTSVAGVIGYILAAAIAFFTWMEHREKRKAIEAKSQAEDRANRAETQVTKTQQVAQDLEVRVQSTEKNALKLSEENQKLSVKAKELEGKLLWVKKGIAEPVELDKGHYRNLMMILGLGGSGKTAVIRTIFNNRNANPKEETQEQKLFRTHMAFNGGRPDGVADQTLHMFACDYRGQDLSTLTRTFVMQQQALYSPMAYGYINALVLVVDLRHPPAIPEDKIPASDLPDTDRIQKHLTEWNDTALDAIAGFVTADTLKFVCLYINKVDALNKASDPEREQFKKLYEPLRARLEKRFKPARVTVIVGSAERGDGYPDLREGLIASCVRVEPDNNTESVEIKP